MTGQTGYLGSVGVYIQSDSSCLFFSNPESLVGEQTDVVVIVRMFRVCAHGKKENVADNKKRQNATLRNSISNFRFLRKITSIQHVTFFTIICRGLGLP